MTSDPSGERRSGFYAGLLVGAAAALAGVALTVALTGDSLESIGSGPTTVEQAQELISENYFKKVSDSDLDEASVRGLVDTIRKRFDDRFSHYFSPDEYDEFQASLNEEVTGIGTTIQEVKNGLRVTAVVPDSPAEGAGIATGDIITDVDGKSIAGQPAEVARTKILGEAGTEVVLTVDPVGDGGPEDVTLERAKVDFPAAFGEVRNVDGTDIGYVRYSSFDQGAHGVLREEIDRVYREGAEGLVLDVRGNGGGRLDEAVLSSSIFIDEGEIVTTRGRTVGTEVYEAEGDALDPRPLVVLIDGGSASATEILTAAIQFYDVGVIVGETSFGKGSVQQSIELPDGSAINLTIAEYLTADGTSLAGEGVTPDVKAPQDLKTKRDESLDRAFEVLEGEIQDAPPA